MDITFEEIVKQHAHIIYVPRDGQPAHRVCVVRHEQGWMIRLISGPSFFWQRFTGSWTLAYSIEAKNEWNSYTINTFEEAWSIAQTVPVSPR